jgi:ribosomal protein L12E/L44/L45/RPP1/RPP2
VAELLEDPNADVVQEARRLAQMLSRLTGEELSSLIESGGEDAASEATAPSKKQQLENGDQGDRSEDGESEDTNRDDEGDDSE